MPLLSSIDTRKTDREDGKPDLRGDPQKVWNFHRNEDGQPDLGVGDHLEEPHETQLAACEQRITGYLKFREGHGVVWPVQDIRQREAIRAMYCGDVQRGKLACVHCAAGRGSFDGCVVVTRSEWRTEDHLERRSISLNGSCANCHMEDAPCSFRSHESRYESYYGWMLNVPPGPPIVQAYHWVLQELEANRQVDVAKARQEVATVEFLKAREREENELDNERT